LYNQWCSVVRWEKETRPFLRTSEFLWQEGHTLHETEEEAQAETIQQLKTYEEMINHLLAIPVVTGRKSESEKFAGAHATYTLEAMMKDGKALQAGTSHNLAQHFTKAFDITYLDRNGSLQNPYHTSWGVSTRLIGALIMTHGDNRGLVLPPRIAPNQVVIVPIMQQKEGVLAACNELYDRLKAKGVRVLLDDSAENSPGWKFNEYEMKGVPVRIELGPRDLAQNQCMISRRDTLEKEVYALDNIENAVVDLLEKIQQNLYEKALQKREEETFDFTTYEEFKERMATRPGFCRAMWNGDPEVEAKIKAETGVTIRCIPFEQVKLSDKCSFTGEPAKYMVIMGKAY
ncbi:MAG: His/Gly/Thr/Pro-type tRNA ligase C-terminal domain-containing protein, partial [Bacillota bacterium]|nr:His/Gly/Thr/Pro-type tRNA ligase C-terminal domain-containing protein [Bacillota bacterium]